MKFFSSHFLYQAMLHWHAACAYIFGQRGNARSIISLSLHHTATSFSPLSHRELGEILATLHLRYP